jgi:hypothetical protein
MMLPARILLLIAACGTAAVAAAAEHSEFANLARAPYIHCAFYKSYDIDPVNGDLVLVEGRANALMHFQAIDIKHSKARAIYTRMAGARDVTVLQTEKAIHFIDNVAGMYVMTTVHSCIDFDEKRGICIAYGAVMSRHFDAAALYDPDSVYEKIKDIAEPGFCDHSFIGVREASKDAR